MPSAEGKGTKANTKRLTFRMRDEDGLTPATEMPVRPSTDSMVRTQQPQIQKTVIT